MEHFKCFICGMDKRHDDKWTYTGIVDLDTGKHVHYTCMEKRKDELNNQLEYKPCCKKMESVAGWKISADVFTETFAVYDPNNDMKYYFNDIRYCPFCGKKIKIIHQTVFKPDDLEKQEPPAAQ